MNQDNICLPTNYVLLILCILIGISTLYIYNNKIYNNSNFNHKIQNNINNSNVNHKIHNDINNSNINHKIQNDINNFNNIERNDKIISSSEEINLLNLQNDITKRMILDKRDRDVINDDFKPPERRLPFHAYPENIKNLINIPSRGYPDNYQLIGLVIRDNTETAYNLFGRQTYPGSNQYEYYVQKTGINDNVKIPIQIKGNKEIEDGQLIDIIGTDKTKGNFNIKLYDYNSPKYNPYII